MPTASTATSSRVAPLVGAWIETKFLRVCFIQVHMSHPSWVRGLKLSLSKPTHHDKVAPLVGAWIETIRVQLTTTSSLVAPLVGAWIETMNVDVLLPYVEKSHPSWVRGLKLPQGTNCQNFRESHPSWVRGLKPQII